jgi:multicomponent Na+:H+ antiporter subunit C
MNTGPGFVIAGFLLFLLGVHGLFVREHLLRKILAANIMGSGVFMVFLALGHDGTSAAPDPVPQAMVLTGIVVAVAFSAVAVVLAVRIQQTHGRPYFPRGGEEDQ